MGLASLVLLAGCGGASDSGASAAGKSDLVVAVPVPLTSGNSAAAQEMVNSAKLAADQINADGGAGGRKIIVNSYDDRLTPDESARIAQRAVTVDKAEVIIGAYTTIEGLAIRQVTEPRKTIFMSSSTISPAFLKDAVYTYRVGHEQTDYPVQMIALLKSLGFTRPAVLADDGPTGATLDGPIKEAATAAGLQPTDTIRYSLNATDVSGPVSQLKASGADAVITTGSSGADAGLIIKTMAEQGVMIPMVGFGSIISPDAQRIGGGGYTRLPAVYTLANQQPSKPQYAQFVQDYAKANGVDAATLNLSEQAGATYDAFKLIDEALDATDGDTDGDKMKAALEGLPPYTDSVAGKEGCQVGFAKSHSAFSLCLVAFKFENGKPVELQQQP
ncbi:ABC transporter substrate-binding protein [Pseudonocardia sp. NPDC049154]|uniref:ABC transporter substrate-binding protein n=1 Tax=Pseudonocardia sp. NPDC049154 TaxID=3155501 RepID=UPI0033F31059